jgi:beta-xylosidase
MFPLVPFVLALLATCAQSSYHAAATTFQNPVIWEDLADLDVFRVGDTFYYSPSTMHYSPGAPVLRSYDLVHWEYVTHSVPELDFGAKYYLNGSGRAYVNGIWASSLRYRPSNDQYYWIGCVDFAQTHVFTAKGRELSAQTRWTGHDAIATCYYDCGLLVDDDDAMYVAYGNTNISVARLSADGLSENTTQVVYRPPGGTYIEGSRFYRINGTYYILVTRPADAELVLRSSSPWGPYTERTLVDQIPSPVNGSGYPHQGGIVDTVDGRWYYMAFIDAYPGGRVPVMAPVTWQDGWPNVVTDQGKWGTSYPVPVQTAKTVEPLTGVDSFRGAQLSAQWEWNHNPDNARWRLGAGGLTLSTATVTTDLFSARNTLTHRILGPQSSGTFRLDLTGMADGDRAGAVLFRDWSSYIGVWREGRTSRLVVVDGLRLDRNNDWATLSNGTVVASVPDFKGCEVFLRITADIRPGGDLGIGGTLRNATLSWSRDGRTFAQLGPEVQMNNDYYFFMGPRYGVFNHATKALGGRVTVKSFELRQ